MKFAEEPVALITLGSSLVNASIPILLLAGVAPDTVAVISGIVTGWSVAALIYARSLVTPNVRVALTHSDAAAIMASQPPGASTTIEP